MPARHVQHVQLAQELCNALCWKNEGSPVLDHLGVRVVIPFNSPYSLVGLHCLYC